MSRERPVVEQGRLHVVAAVIDDPAGRILIARRPQHLHQGGLWEFPGGKCEPEETPEAALVRELQEELGITATAFRHLIDIVHDYPDRRVHLDVWRVTAFSGRPHGAEGQEVMWVDAAEMRHYDFPAANVPIISAALLPDCYLITPEPGPCDNWPQFLRQLDLSLRRGISLVQLRAKQLEYPQLTQLAPQVIALCHSHAARVLLNGEPGVADELGFDGVHLDSRRLIQCEQRPLQRDKLLAASCHSENELHMAAMLDCDFAVLSPVAATASHPGVAGMGWQRFAELVCYASVPVFALGGMLRGDLDQAWHYGAQGIAAIGGLWGNDGEI